MRAWKTAAISWPSNMYLDAPFRSTNRAGKSLLDCCVRRFMSDSRVMLLVAFTPKSAFLSLQCRQRRVLMPTGDRWQCLWIESYSLARDAPAMGKCTTALGHGRAFGRQKFGTKLNRTAATACAALSACFQHFPACLSTQFSNETLVEVGC